jgi:tRNA-2-methylthio-N6-dimethylallyladenosine synthase
MSKFFIKTWGCQMNVLDGDKIASLMESLGHEKTENIKDANIILLNTCSVREGPENKVFSELARLKPLKEKNLEILGIVGCVAQQEKAVIFKRAPYVDLVMGPRSLMHLPELLEQAKTQKTIETSDAEDSLLFPPEILRRSHPTRASITVMEGCNKKCAFCIVPETRGREVYRPLDSILDEVKRSVDGGYKEIELLGQNVNCWKSGGKHFTNLLDEVSRTEGVKRIRFMTSYPKHFPVGAAKLMAERENVCPYLHLPLQAGSSRILKLMRRQYDQEFYLDLIKQIKEIVPGITLSTDIIVGFPTETEEDFAETIKCVETVGFDAIYSFRYSERPGTSAAEMEKVPESVARERHQRLFDLQFRVQSQRHRDLIGMTFEVLLEGVSKMGGQYMGRAANNIVVNFTSPHQLKVNEFYNVVVSESFGNSLKGELKEL